MTQEIKTGCVTAVLVDSSAAQHVRLLISLKKNANLRENLLFSNRLLRVNKPTVSLK